ncbi:DUF4124 domain-containing protein [Oryzomicrobium sp.]|uniref:DUF4124 domain-containing protein n=1 Tax=Oryzomicrobium sp. TaxID=1911578 RepID=UPI0025CCED4E|nr:DUF4124 domain-containing protein [Oryzomicrobium sp.]MCE1242809.1 DUF4124 domain-containing protein [Oryzomicrobium sp.]
MPIFRRSPPAPGLLSRGFAPLARAAAIAGIAALAGLAGQAGAETYIWKDANGKTIISDSPPPRTSKTPARSSGGDGKNPGYALPADKAEAAQGKNAQASSNGAPAAAPKTMADKDLEFRKRQMENRDQEEKAAKEAQDKARRQDECKRASEYLAALQNGQRIARFNDKGEREILDDAQRDSEIARSRQSVNELCK